MNNYIQRMKNIIKKNDIPVDVIDIISRRIGYHLLEGGTLSDTYIRQQLDYLINVSKYGKQGGLVDEHRYIN